MAGSSKKEMQLRWDALCAEHDKRGFTDHALIARFLSDEVNRGWPSLIENSLQVAYKLLGLRRPRPQGKAGYIAAIRTRILALLSGDEQKSAGRASSCGGSTR